MATTMHDPLAGRLLDDRYQLIARLASGGMATVYRAVDTRLDRPVAIKLLHETWAADPQAVSRFAREARSAARLSHPDVVAVFDQGDEGGEPFLVMEYVAGGTLRDVIRDRGRLAPGEAVAVMDHVLAALAAAHRIGLVHRDVKPENVLVTTDGRVKVADFGLARAMADSSITTTTTGLIGTAAYLAPEQWAGQPADARSDVYAAGLLLFELLTGAPPFAGDPPHVIMRRHLEETVPAPSSVAPGVPAELDRVVGWATRRDPSERPADAGELHTALMAAARRLGLTLVVPALPVAVTQRLSTAMSATRSFAAAPATAGGDGVAATAPVTGASRGRRRRRWPWVLLVVLVISGAAAALGWWFAAGRFVAAPDLRGLTKSQANARLSADGLTGHWEAPRYSSSVKRDHVVFQSPDGGSDVVRHGTVDLALSKGPSIVTVPSVAGESESAATRNLERNGLTVSGTRRQYSSSIPAHQAIGTDPPAGHQLNAGQSVTLITSRGPKPVQVADVTGKPVDVAVAELQQQGLGTTVKKVYSDTVPVGSVVSTAPAAGTTVNVGKTVTVDESKGPQLFEVPDVTGENIDKAITTLKEAGFTPKPEQIFPGGPNDVVRESPGGHSMQPRGTTIELDYF